MMPEYISGEVPKVAPGMSLDLGPLRERLSSFAAAPQSAFHFTL
jgi:hypothetical protein